MTAIAWDQVGQRRFETGIDRGVLFPLNGTPVPWNGLTAVTEIKAREVKSYYIDGVKYLDHHVPGAFAGKLQAFTYPDELEDLVGTAQMAPGVFVHDQPVKLFHLSYRTRMGNDLEGVEHGYKLHLLYNLTASQGDTTLSTVGAQITPQTFEWTLSGVPATLFGIRPTSHVSLDSRLVDEDLLDSVESLLYGTVSTDPSFPDLVELLTLAEIE